MVHLDGGKLDRRPGGSGGRSARAEREDFRGRGRQLRVENGRRRTRKPRGRTHRPRPTRSRSVHARRVMRLDCATAASRNAVISASSSRVTDAQGALSLSASVKVASGITPPPSRAGAASRTFSSPVVSSHGRARRPRASMSGDPDAAHTLRRARRRRRACPAHVLPPPPARFDVRRVGAVGGRGIEPIAAERIGRP